MGYVPTERNIADAIGSYTFGREAFSFGDVTFQMVARGARSYRVVGSGA